MKTTFVHPTAAMWEPFRHFQFGRAAEMEYRESALGESVYIGAHAVIGRGAKIGNNCVIDHHCIVEPNAMLGDGCLVIYRAMIGSEAVLGDGCVIGGFIAERCIVGKGSRVFGKVLHNQHDTTVPWDEFETPEPSAIIGDYAFVGFNALIVGGITIGERAYVCANAVVTKDVPPIHIAVGINKFVPASEWKGKLANNPLFHGKDPSTTEHSLQ